MRELTILKIGGNVLDNSNILKSVLDNFADWSENKILVHGGGKLASLLLKQLGIEPVMKNGRRVTDEKTLEIVTMVYAGLINKNLVCQLQSRQCNTIGLTGADGNTIPAIIRPVKDIDYGFVGDINPVNINSKLIISLIENKFVPVFAPITHDQNGQLLNTNADTIASSIAISLAKDFKVKLIYCFEKNGVLSNPEDDLSVINNITESIYKDYKDKGIIHSGMIPKLDNAYAALKSGVAEINICGPEAFSKEKIITGTTIIL